MKVSVRNFTWKLATIATVAMVSVSCTKDLISDPNSLEVQGAEQHITAAADIPRINNGEKAHLHPGGNHIYKVYWDNADVLRVNGYDLNLAWYDNNYANPRASFEGNTAALEANNQHIYWAVYPPSIGAVSSGIPYVNTTYGTNTLTYTMAATQTFDESADTMKGNTYMAGYVNVPSGETNFVFAMKNLGTVLKINLSAAQGLTTNEKKIHKLVFSCANNHLCGNFNFNYSTEAITYNSSGSETITVFLKNVANNQNYIDISSGAKDVYVILPPIATGQVLKMQVYNIDGGYVEKTKTLSSSSNPAESFERSTYYSVTTDITAYTSPGISVASNRKVVFAPGNLQYRASSSGTAGDITHTTANNNGTNQGQFRFAANQWDIIGSGNSNISSTYTGWIDLFGWGTSGWSSGAVCYQPWSVGVDNGGLNNSDYYPGSDWQNTLTGACSNADWGVYNAIYNQKTGDTDPYSTWRLLTSAEWEYMLRTRSTTSGIRFAKGYVHGIGGLIIVPDNWNTSIYTLTSTNTDGANFSTNNISDADWLKMENAGCVFLPTAGCRYPSNDARGTNYFGDLSPTAYGYYWTSSIISENAAYRGLVSNDYTDFYYDYGGGNYAANHIGNRSRGESVRLVKVIFEGNK